jgi:formylglycine-generating enzyme required for sulfatase activity
MVAANRTPKIFISSTLEDLEPYRLAADAAVRRLNWIPINCGYWSAGGNPPLGTCLSAVDRADVVLVIVGHRHGWTPPGQPDGQYKSITRLECERGKANGLQVIPFFVDEGAAWNAKLREEHRISEAKPDEMAVVAEDVVRNLRELKAFKAWLESIGTRTIFSKPEQLETEVLHSLTEWAKASADFLLAHAPVRMGYLEWLRGTCESVELLGLDRKEAQSVRLGQVYVPAVTAARPEFADADSGGIYDNRYELLLHRLGENSLYVPGAPGSGKSTFCRWLALCVATGAIPQHPVSVPRPFIEELPEDLRRRFPFLCRLREWSGHNECWIGNGQWTRAQLEQALCKWIDAVKPGGLTSDAFCEELRNGHCLLVFDGVDEVPETLDKHLPRLNLLSGLADALPVWLKAGNRLLLTSRPYGVDVTQLRRLRLPVADLAELPLPLQQTFIARWYAAADALRAEEKTAGLTRYLSERSDLQNLRANPMLLTALCIKFDEGQRLPKDFYRLYDSVVAQVLYKRYLTDIERDRAHRRLAAVALDMHGGRSGRYRPTPWVEVSTNDVDRALAALSQSDWATEGGGERAAVGREDLLSNSGLLLPRAERRAAFYHFSFQEFFAAVRLRRIDIRTRSILEETCIYPAWRRTLVFLFCAVADQESEEAAAQAYADALLPWLNRAALTKNPNPGLLLADCLEVAHARGWNLEQFSTPFRHACEYALDCVSPPIRAQLWRALGRVGLDDRRGVSAIHGVPDIDWVGVSEGVFKFGSKKVEWIPLGAFHISRYPVTHAQYQCFVADGGYRTDRFWQTRRNRPEPASAAWSDPNHPREMVSWYEAVAFARWLDERLHDSGLIPKEYVIRLPTEVEWEKAARGREGRDFPWGNDFETGNANVNETVDNKGPYYLRRTSPVGIYPRGASPYGVLDMAGNVWEWCLTKGNGDSYDLRGSGVQVARGSAWDLGSAMATCYSTASTARPWYRRETLGFRVVCAKPLS